jgi:hypothetical protein
MQLIVEYTRDVLAHLSGRYRAAVDALPAGALTWRPGDDRTNSVAQIVRHVARGQDLILARALGTGDVGEPADDRDRGLHNDPATHRELRDLIGWMDSLREERLTVLDGMDLAEVVPVPGGAARTRFFWVAHSVGEAREHIGHAELTVQLCAQAQSLRERLPIPG